MDVESSSRHELNKDQYVVSTYDPKGPEDLDADSILLPEVLEDHEVLSAGAINEENTQKTSNYYTKMDLDVGNIDKNENKTW